MNYLYTTVTRGKSTVGLRNTAERAQANCTVEVIIQVDAMGQLFGESKKS